MKKSSLSVRTTFWFLLFTIGISIFLYFFQIKFLDFYYEKNQINQIQSVADKIKKDSNELLFSSYLEKLSYESNICMRYVYGSNEMNYNSYNNGCILQRDNKLINKYINQLRNDDTAEYIKLIAPNGVKSILYVVEIGEDDSYVVLSTNLENLDVATNLLRQQMIYIFLVLILLGIIFSYFVSKQINKPIVNLIDSANELEKGNYDVKFDGGDIAELNELADVLTVAASEMKNTDSLRRDLIANVSHDLKTPLTMIKAYAEKVRDLSYKDDEKREKDLNVIISESDRLNGLVNDLLNLSKLEENNSKMNITKYNLIDQINDVLKRYDIIQEQDGYTINLDLPTEEIMIKADRSRIDQVLYNLINNAIEHTGDDKKVYISVKQKRGQYIVVIKDTGKGIKKEDIPLVWNKYYTKEKNYKRNVVGTGLGLSIVKNILEKHNFEYGINSKLNEYTEFYFKFNKIK